MVASIDALATLGGAGFGNTSLPYHGAERYSSTELGSTGVLLVQSDVAEQESSGERRSRFRNRKFLRQGKRC